MTPLRLGWALLILTASAVSLLLSHRSRTIPALRPAAWAVAAFAVLDAARFAWSPAAVAHVWPWNWIDVAVMVTMPACWMGLLVAKGARVGEEGEHGPRLRHKIVNGSAPKPPTDGGHPVADRDGAHDALGGEPRCLDGGVQYGLKERRVDGADDGRGRPHARILPRILPSLLCLSYSLLLLSLRHSPAVLAHWTGLLQVPRVVAFGWALGVALRWRAAGAPTVPRLPPRQRTYTLQEFLRAVLDITREQRPPLSPSTAIGLSLSLASGIAVAGGLWADWRTVQALSALSWLVVAAIALRARRE